MMDDDEAAAQEQNRTLRAVEAERRRHLYRFNSKLQEETNILEDGGGDTSLTMFQSGNMNNQDVMGTLKPPQPPVKTIYTVKHQTHNIDTDNVSSH